MEPKCNGHTSFSVGERQTVVIEGHPFPAGVPVNQKRSDRVQQGGGTSHVASEPLIHMLTPDCRHPNHAITGMPPNTSSTSRSPIILLSGTADL